MPPTAILTGTPASIKARLAPQTDAIELQDIRNHPYDVRELLEFWDHVLDGPPGEYSVAYLSAGRASRHLDFSH